jgi:hydrogenase large subunit
MQAKLKKFVESGQLGIFANGYWGHPEYKLPPEANLMAVSHYLEALAWQRDVVKLHAIFGGKNPHPNFVVGGVPCAIDLESDAALNAKKFSQVLSIIQQMQEFVAQVYVPDTIAIAGFYKDWFKQGEGLGNFMTYGDFPSNGSDPASFMIPSGVILNRNLNDIQPIDLNAPEQIQEFAARAWYDYSKGKTVGLHPYDGETVLNYTGPEPPYQFLEVEKEYSWLKSPRWRGHAVEVGPLARMLMLYATGHAQAKELVDSTLNKLELPITALYSTLGRTAARTLETQMIADAMTGWYNQLIANVKAGDTKTFNETLWEPKTWAKQARGVGFMEAPRGGLAHWIVIEDEKIANYQAVVPSTWNAGPRDAQNQVGAYEASLQGHHLHDTKQPLEILRTIHSFDPCLACAVHVCDTTGREVTRVQVN